MITPLLYLAAALAEIAGCFSVWAWWRLEKSPLWLVEQRAPDRWDLLGATICLLGAGVILFGPRGA